MLRGIEFYRRVVWYKVPSVIFIVRPSLGRHGESSQELILGAAKSFARGAKLKTVVLAVECREATMHARAEKMRGQVGR